MGDSKGSFEGVELDVATCEYKQEWGYDYTESLKLMSLIAKYIRNIIVIIKF